MIIAPVTKPRNTNKMTDIVNNVFICTYVDIYVQTVDVPVKIC